MEKFVVRGHAARECAEQAAVARGGRRTRQTRIQDGSKVVVEEQVQLLRDEIDNAKTTANMLSILETLEGFFMSLEMMEKTRIGVSLSRLERRAESDGVKLKCRQLLKIWKARAKKAMRRRKRRVQTYGRTAAE